MIATQEFSWTILRVSQKNVGVRMVHNTNVQQSICAPLPLPFFERERIESLQNQREAGDEKFNF